MKYLSSLIVIMSVALLVGCPESRAIDNTPTVTTECNSGETRTCICASQKVGVRVCDDTGFFEACECDETDGQTDGQVDDPTDNDGGQDGNGTSFPQDAGSLFTEDGGSMSAAFDSGGSNGDIVDSGSDDDDSNVPPSPSCRDLDEDGFFICNPLADPIYDGGLIPPQEIDCNDSLWHVQPGGAEVSRNGIDDNCNGQIDEIANGCFCASGNTQSAVALARGMGLCGETLLSASTHGAAEQRNTQPSYFGIPPRSGTCVSLLSTGKVVATDHSQNPTTLFFVSNDNDASFECKVDEGVWAACTADFELPTFTSGIHKVQIRAKDTHGHFDPVPLVYQWDAQSQNIMPGRLGGEMTLPPPSALSLSYPEEGASVADLTPYVGGDGPRGAVTRITMTNASDNSVLDFEVNVDPTGRWALSEAQWNSQMLLDGQAYTVTVSSSQGGALAPINITVDTQSSEPTYAAATLTLIEELSGGGVRVYFESQADASFECRSDDQAWVSCESPHHILGLDDNLHSFNVRSLFGGVVEPTSAGLFWQTVEAGLVIMNPQENDITSRQMPAFTGRGRPNVSVYLVLQRLNGDQVATEWNQNMMIGPDGRFTAVFAPLSIDGEYRINVSQPDFSTAVVSTDFTFNLAGTGTEAPGTFMAGYLDVQLGTDFGVTTTDPDPGANAGGGAGNNGNGNGNGNSGGDAETVFDLAHLEVVLKKPSNVEGFAFNFMFLSSEFPEFLCQVFNDTFYAVVTTASLGQEPVNASFDPDGNEITVNNAFFEPVHEWTIPLQLSPFGQEPVDAMMAACSSEATTDPSIWDDTCILPEFCNSAAAVAAVGSGSGWLTTTVPLTDADDIIKINFSVHDEGDGAMDSLVLLDNFRWVVDAQEVSTGKEP